MAAVRELYALALHTASRLGRPITVFDVIRFANDAEDRARRLRLIRDLRSGR